MAKNSVPEWDTTPANNTDVGGINIDENCPARGINNALRTIMAQVKSDRNQTIEDGRLPATMSTKTFTDRVVVRGVAPIYEWRETDVAGTAAWYGVMDSVGLSFRYQDLGNIFLDMQPTGVFLWQGNKIYHAGNDGAGSGMDTDFFRGQAPSYYTDITARLGYTPLNSANPEATGRQKVSGGAPYYELHETDVVGGASWFWVMDGVGMSFRYQDFGNVYLNIEPTGVFQFLGNTIWHAGNDGATSGLDADLLDGVDGALYLQHSQLRGDLSAIGVDELGCVALLSRVSAATINQGDTSLGSQLRFSNIDGSNLGSAPNGNWRALSRVVGGAGIASVGFFRRIS